MLGNRPNHRSSLSKGKTKCGGAVWITDQAHSGRRPSSPCFLHEHFASITLRIQTPRRSFLCFGQSERALLCLDGTLYLDRSHSAFLAILYFATSFPELHLPWQPCSRIRSARNGTSRARWIESLSLDLDRICLLSPSKWRIISGQSAEEFAYLNPALLDTGVCHGSHPQGRAQRQDG